MKLLVLLLTVLARDWRGGGGPPTIDAAILCVSVCLHHTLLQMYEVKEIRRNSGIIAFKFYAVQNYDSK